MLDGETPHNPTGLSDQTRRAIEPLRLSKAKLDTLSSELISRARIPIDLEPLKVRCTERKKSLQDSASATCVNLDQLLISRTEAELACQQAKYEHELTREPHRPDVFVTLCITFILLLVEGILTAAILAAEGKMGPTEAIVIGAIFAFTNVAVGQVAGYFGLRNALFRKRPELDQDEVQRRRRFGWPFLLSCLGLLAALIFAAARVRATGSHTGIFDFSVVSVWATFDDAIALAILAIGLVWSVLNLWKGAVGYDDSVPGYSDAWKKAERLDMEAENAADAGLDHLDEHTDDFVAIVEGEIGQLTDEAKALRRDLSSFGRKAAKHNARVEALCDKAVGRERSLRKAGITIQHRDCGPDGERELIRLFDSLRCRDVNIAEGLAALDAVQGISCDAERLISDLEAERDREAGRIEAALSRYFAGHPDFDQLQLLKN